MTVLLAVVWWPLMIALALVAAIVSVTVVFEMADRYGRRVVDDARRNLDENQGAHEH